MIASALLLVALELFPVPCGKGAREPQLSVGADGHVALAWGAKDEIHYCFGDPQDPAGFGRVQTVSKKLRYSVGMRRGPRIALLDGDRVVLTVIGGELGGGKDGDVWAWPADVRVNSVAGSAREGLHALARSAQGELYCAWIDLRSGKPQIWGARSSDRGATWKDEALLSKDAEICPCCAPSACFDAQGSAYVMWRGVREGSRDMQLVRCDKAGIGAPVKLGTGSWKIDGCPMDGGALAESGGKVSGVWRREKSVYLSSDNADERLLGAGEQPWIAGGRIVWIEHRGGKLLALAPGAKDPETLDDSANDPVIASSPDGQKALYAAWETGAGDESEIKLARLAPR